MDINIDNFKITGDDKNFILKEKRICQKDTKLKKKGEVYYEDIGYYTKLEHLINTILTLKIKRANITTLNELKDKIIEFKEYIQKAFEGV